ncbi:hypothetical protein [Micromonospora sp. KC721]|uniref:hypothetical protein n=1 Tax=Micromonospora sp. KC721 TaxID=2530380 RepID=UPI001052859F|nr:hypothetical protein [Micromonospora sp. KC721]TDB72224.1 hypothetical protein E1182_23565 [Micromonospora sp. KC721]
MAQRNSSGRGGTATRTRQGNQTPNTPGISESEISRMRVDDIRGQLRRRGVAGISALRKPELVKTLARTLRAEGSSGGAARRATGPAGRAPAGKSTAGRAAASGRAKAAPAPARKAAPAARKGAPARTGSPIAGKATTARAEGPAASRAKAAPARSARAKAAPASRAKAAPASRAKAAPAPATRATPGKGTSAKARTGAGTSRSVRSSQLITAPTDRPERPGRSLVTTNHEVIQNWARARGARPATIAGTERNGRPGVLTFEIPGYRESSRVQVITWDDWFRTFDERKLNLIYQEELRDGRQSNFFRTESPDREDG